MLHKSHRKVMSMMLVLGLLFSPFMIPAGSGSAEEGNFELNVLHTNDIHSSIDDLAKTAAYIDSVRDDSEYSLYLDAGDIFSGNPVVDLQEGEPLINILNEMSVDAMVIGNHEFDYGQEAFARNEDLANFPWLSANTEVIDEDIPIEQPDPYIIKDMGEFTVGILALTQAPPATAPAGIVGLEFHPYEETVEQYEYLKDEVDVLIGLNHIGFGADRQVAESFPGLFDVIVGGHTHTVLQEPNTETGTPIVQAGANNNYVGNLSIEIDRETQEVVGVEGFLQEVEELTEANSEIQKMIDDYNAEMDEILAEVIGYTNTGLDRDTRYEEDAPLGNFWTDAMREYVQADIALTNNGGIRASIEPGEITAGDIYTIEPFANEIMEIEMTGHAIKDVIEYSYNRRDQLDLQTSGMHYTILTDEEGKLVDVDMYLGGEPMNLDDKYVLAIPDFLGTGGSGYNFEGNVIRPGAGFMTNAMIDFAETFTSQGEDIDYTSEGRITVELYEEEEDDESKRPPHAGKPGKPPHAGTPGPPEHAGRP
ncbi:bifunctional metallophosphatase/5'-nucleotidase [Alteribacter natronophilus]|uniref:bifunctional metallophosphatase/5'-nucleotidase n=1 Tax=Alteribacter natronophilus TaxID=2583810 RepID=UPI00110D399F|nr:bifunctional UDP-sugar hydrolase/5'-nucleotidase [Alteribacter natronophilus]TMW72361.1 bifunctional metallophosphatase/5'-nucleotidase [Alteribacter natronophilus]